VSAFLLLPGDQFRHAAPVEGVEALVGPQQGLLHDVRRVELAPQPRVQLQPGQQVQVFAVALQGPTPVLPIIDHRST